MMLKPICNWFSKAGVIFSPEDQELLRQHTREVRLPRNDILLQQGKPAPKLFFLNSGVVRLFKVHNGMDITLDFISAGEFVSTAVYVLNQQPSPCSLQALTRVEALEWERTDLVTFEEQLVQSEKVKGVLLERLLNWNMAREVDIMTLMPEERYLKLMSLQPDVIRSVPLKYIASYLGIHNDSLSRIRKKMSERPSDTTPE